MLKDSYDSALVLLLAATLAALCFVLAGGSTSAGDAAPAGVDKSLERELAYQARVALLQKIYAPVDGLVRAGELQRALFKLDELAQRYPSEAHGYILRAEILQKMGALDQALHSYVDGVRLNPDYLDRRSPLTRRADIEQAAESGVKMISARLRSNPENVTLAASLKEVNYLRSRLAGGCE